MSCIPTEMGPVPVHMVEGMPVFGNAALELDDAQAAGEIYDSQVGLGAVARILEQRLPNADDQSPIRVA